MPFLPAGSNLSDLHVTLHQRAWRHDDGTFRVLAIEDIEHYDGFHRVTRCHGDLPALDEFVDGHGPEPASCVLQ
jgi:hypothetical protein